MYIMESMRHNYGGFTLDTASTGSTSTSKTAIKLPYSGPLPADLDDATGAAIVIALQVGLTVNVLLTGERLGKVFRYPVAATPGEIDHILQSFFFTGDGHTRHDNGLTPYTLGFNQANYVSWKRLTLDADGLDNLLPQLSPASAQRILQHIEHSKTA